LYNLGPGNTIGMESLGF